MQRQSRGLADTYLVGTADKDIILNPKSHSFDCFVDADFIGNWDKETAAEDPATAKSRTGCIIFCGGCPLTWASRLQREVALSSAESECNAVSESLRCVLHLMDLVEDARTVGWNVAEAAPRVHCKAFEDNSAALEMARPPKMRPRTKHTGMRMHHFREHVRQGKISIHKIPSECQLGDMATKPQGEKLFLAQRDSTVQWSSEHMTVDQLKQPATHLRACEIVEQASFLNKQAAG